MTKAIEASKLPNGKRFEIYNFMVCRMDLKTETAKSLYDLVILN
jgi:hypothetical protein